MRWINALGCRIAPALLLTLSAFSSAGEDLSDGRTGKIPFDSTTPTEELAVISGRLGPRVTVEGTLTLPTGSPPPYAVIVIAHGSGGIHRDREPRWAEQLAKAGIASFIVDSYGPRKVTGTDTGDVNVSTMANIADAFAALRLLSTHPLLDKRKIGILGFSRGGQVALWTALEPVRHAFMGSSGLAFAAHVLIYPACNLQRISAHISNAPMLHLHGEADDLAPLAPCRDYLDRLRASGANARTVTYAGAYHDFDYSAPARYQPRVRSARNCHAEINLDDRRYFLLPERQPLASRKEYADYERSCTTWGATVGGNGKARAEAYVDAIRFLREALALP
jgi:dienelactone hydrolase